MPRGLAEQGTHDDGQEGHMNDRHGTARERLDPASTTVHETLELRPGAERVFRRFGIDTCCGGDLPLETAAEHHGVELTSLLDALERARAGS